MDEQGLLSYVKKVIHSLIVSTPERVTVERLKRDYAKEEGTAVPFKRLGFKDIESFLHSIPDTVVVGFELTVDKCICLVKSLLLVSRIRTDGACIGQAARQDRAHSKSGAVPKEAKPQVKEPKNCQAKLRLSLAKIRSRVCEWAATFEQQTN